MPQVLYRNSLPEVNENMEKSSEVPVVQDAPKPTIKWLWLLVAFVLIAAVAIGVGVGTWHDRRKGIRYYLPQYTHTSHLLTSHQSIDFTNPTNTYQCIYCTVYSQRYITGSCNSS